MKTARVLFLDDEPRRTARLVTALVAHGFEVEQAHTLDEFEALFGSSEWDALLLDIMTPKASVEDPALRSAGVGLLERIRSGAVNARLSNIPVVVLTATTEYRAELSRLGVRWYCQKPTSTGQILAALAAVLEGE